jgi:hypothetical protein
MGFRLAFGSCSAKAPNLWKSPLAVEVCAAVLARIEDLRGYSSENLAKLPPQVIEQETVLATSVEFTTVYEVFDNVHFVVVMAFVSTFKFPTYIGSLGIGHLVAEGLVIEDDGRVRDASEEEMYAFR